MAKIREGKLDGNPYNKNAGHIELLSFGVVKDVVCSFGSSGK